MILYKNEYFELVDDDGVMKIKVYKPDFQVKELNGIILRNPSLNIVNFNSLKNALVEASSLPIVIGTVKPRVEVYISDDKMQASIKLNITAQEFDENKVQIATEIVRSLEKFGINAGLETIFSKPISVQKEIIIAQGLDPDHGSDAKIRLLELHNKIPVTEPEGKKNFYELNLIDNINKGDWLGEMTPATLGYPGESVTGEIILPIPGKPARLLFDQKTVQCLHENGKSVLRAKVDGALRIENGKVIIDDHLIIKGDVDYVTGNINFGGHVTVNGVVQDGFTVIAKNDISINGNIGLGSVNQIISLEGSIFIKGGIYGKGVSKIVAEKDVFLKYCNDTEISAKGNVNIGYYALDCVINATNVLLDSSHGKILGGETYAEISVSASEIGTKSEKPTLVCVKGFDVGTILLRLSKLSELHKSHQTELKIIRVKLDTIIKIDSGSSEDESPELRSIQRLYENELTEIKKIESELLQIKFTLSIKGEGEISASRSFFPRVQLTIKDETMVISEIVSGKFYLDKGEFVHLK